MNVAVGIDVVVAPLIIFVAPVKLCAPELAVNVVALLVKLPPKLIIEAAVSFQIEPLFSVTLSVNVFALVPPRTIEPETDVAPPILSEKLAPVVKVVPFPNVKLFDMVRLTTVVVVDVPLKERVPIVVVPVDKVFAPLPEKFKTS